MLNAKSAVAILFAFTMAAPLIAEEPPKQKVEDKLIEEVNPKEAANKRGRRNQRWELSFGPMSAADYLKQADALGMYLVFPDKKGDPVHVADLKERPAKVVPADPKAWKRNFFTDDRKDSCESVADVLKLESVPIALIFFYPIELENELLKKELAFKDRKEEEIESTKFKVTLKDGKALIEVVQQKVFKTDKKP